MIETVLVLPSPRALLPGLSRTDPVAELRAACLAAVSTVVAARPERLVVIAPPVGELNRARGVTEPLGHRVARHLLGEVPFVPRLAVPSATAALLEEAVSHRTTLVVMADGSASRSEKAPGHVHPEAVALDDVIDRALAAGDGDALAALDPRLAEEVWCQGVPGFHVLAEVARGRAVSTEVSYADAPYGVAWWVARWDLARPVRE